MKKTVSIMLALIVILSCFFGCGNKITSKKADIVCTTFPLYDWVTQILGENPAGLTCSVLQDNGVDLHSYQPSADDIVAINNAKLFLFIGGESDKWVYDILDENKELNTLNAIDVLGDFVIPEDTFETSTDVQDDEEDFSDVQDVDCDEHIWLSIKNAKKICRNIGGKLATIDKKNRGVYVSNATQYVNQLNNLDINFKSRLREVDNRTLVFADRFPFAYLCKDYSIVHYAAFSGCSAETEASFETIAYLATTVDNYKIKHILVIEGGNQSIAESIIQNTNSKDQDILTLNSIQSQVNENDTYLSIMQTNFDTIITAMS